MQQVRKPIPKSPAERVNDAITPYELGGATKPNLPRENRAEKVSVKGGRDKDFSVKLIDIDTAVIEHIKNNIKPTVYQNTEVVDVPVIYAFPERWVAMQKDGFLRDGTGKIMSPLIVINRTDVTKNRNISRNLDSNLAQNVHIFQKGYTSKNAYDRFDLINNRVPVKEFAVVAHPDYVTITYEMNVYANFMEQINRLIESVQYAENSYWGDKRRYQFRVNIDSFPSVVSYGQNDERVVSSKLTLKLHGHLIPDTVNAFLSKEASFVSKGQVIFNEQVSSNVTNEVIQVQSNKITNTSPTTPPQYDPAMVSALTLYLNTNNSAKARYDSSNQATLVGKSILQAPYPLPPTNEQQFTIFINGINADYRYFDLQQVGSDIVFTFDTSPAGLGYPLISDDDILIVGKFS